MSIIWRNRNLGLGSQSLQMLWFEVIISHSIQAKEAQDHRILPRPALAARQREIKPGILSNDRGAAAKAIADQDLDDAGNLNNGYSWGNMAVAHASQTPG
ncbi:hypothetical protein ACJ73_07177 [Blastomyces percursus]|uniref:Uncharacterized protein n=1 Tax=Blastomyces percursus TaxID=1658174 RepID=A0A1J9QZ38_9EURO|nr:hypothetical protein ACJ73_07177 [Blastomyces percursus]